MGKVGYKNSPIAQVGFMVDGHVKKAPLITAINKEKLLVANVNELIKMSI